MGDFTEISGFYWNIRPSGYIGPTFLYYYNCWSWTIIVFFRWKPAFQMARVRLLLFSIKLFTWFTYVSICHPALLNEKCLSKEIPWLNARFIKVTEGNRIDGLEWVRRLHGDAIKAKMPKAFKKAMAMGMKNKWARIF